MTRASFCSKFDGIYLLHIFFKYFKTHKLWANYVITSLTRIKKALFRSIIPYSIESSIFRIITKKNESKDRKIHNFVAEKWCFSDSVNFSGIFYFFKSYLLKFQMSRSENRKINKITKAARIVRRIYNSHFEFSILLRVSLCKRLTYEIRFSS